ncbi:MAG: formylglycine-generating enzyme family protein [Rhodospirillaceae bacterium]
MVRHALLFCFTLFAVAPAFAAETFRDCGDCPEMIVIPAGSFRMGSSQQELNNNEGPQRTVTIRKPFAVGIYAVTFQEWGACVAGGGCNSYVPPDEGWGRGNRPVISVNWHEAKAYVRWLNEMLRSLRPETEGATAASATISGPYRLLSEAEWEYAARAGTTTRYYWGDAHERGKANCDRCGSEWDNRQTAPVGSFPPNAFGLYDMAGNVLQWVEDCYHDSYAGAPTNGAPLTAGKCEARVMRGGSWFNSTYYLRSSQRFIVSPHIRGTNAGFRVAKTLD